jgi:hypothetical protein
LALARSLERQGVTRPLVVLVADAAEVGVTRPADLPALRLITPRELRASPALEAMNRRLQEDGNLDQYRWALKPILVGHMLSEAGPGVVCVDCDLHFFGTLDGLLEAMNGASVVLTPHWHDHRLGVRNTGLDITLAHGFFNAGFVAVTPQGRAFAEWWARACAYRCETAPERGVFVDQRYLDAVPHLFPGTHILRHQGYNVAQWNLGVCERVPVDGRVMINGRWPVVCVHFYRKTMAAIRGGRDPLLLPHLQQYEAEIARGREQVQAGVVAKPLAVPTAQDRRRTVLTLRQKALRMLGARAMTVGRRVYAWATPAGYER